MQSAALENGLLTITLKREVPEAMKPRKLDISTTAQPASTTEKDQARLKRLRAIERPVARTWKETFYDCATREGPSGSV